MDRLLKKGDVFKVTKKIQWPGLPCGVEYETPKSSKLYVVEETDFTGGGTGHGPGDVYPNGHRVTARQLGKDRNYETYLPQIKFYQSGCFINEILPEDIELVSKMRFTVTGKEEPLHED